MGFLIFFFFFSSFRFIILAKMDWKPIAISRAGSHPAETTPFVKLLGGDTDCPLQVPVDQVLDEYSRS